MPLLDLDNPKLTFVQKRLITLYGRVYIGHYQQPDWSGSLPFYAFNCHRHGTVANYPQGYSQTLRCPKCMKGETQ